LLKYSAAKFAGECGRFCRGDQQSLLHTAAKFAGLSRFSKEGSSKKVVTEKVLIRGEREGAKWNRPRSRAGELSQAVIAGTIRKRMRLVKKL
jgi:hypothetical protein